MFLLTRWETLRSIFNKGKITLSCPAIGQTRRHCEHITEETVLQEWFRISERIPWYCDSWINDNMDIVRRISLLQTAKWCKIHIFSQFFFPFCIHWLNSTFVNPLETGVLITILYNYLFINNTLLSNNTIFNNT